MTTLARRHAPPAPPPTPSPDPALWRAHPLGRAEFLAAVFSGPAAAIGEVAGQGSWAIPHKFALPDPRSGPSDDFAHTAGAPLPRWPDSRLEPTDALCFVFSDDDHPHLHTLVARGGREHDHFVVLTRPPLPTAPPADTPLRALLQRADHAGPVVILGYGDQGRRLAHHLRRIAPAAARRALVIDGNPASRLAAQNDGFATADQSAPLPESAAAAIYTPLARHPGLFTILITLAARGVPALADPHAGEPHFAESGPYRLDRAAARALHLSRSTLRAQPHGLPVEAVIVREDLRRLGPREVPHLHAMERRDLTDRTATLDLAAQGRDDRLSPATFIRAQRAYIGLCAHSLGATAPLGCFAGREFCSRFWPEATAAVMPAQNWGDLGRTPFERRLQRYAASRTVGTSLQSWAQQVLLGVCAAHYAGADPDAAILEIGCATGGTTALLAAATTSADAGPGPRLFTIDPDPAMLEINRFVARQDAYTPRHRPIVATSDDALPSLRHLESRLSLVFIDGDHTAAAVARDFENYAPLLRRGGALLFHDVGPRDLGVLNVILDRVIPDGRFDPICLVDTMAVFERRV